MAGLNGLAATLGIPSGSHSRERGSRFECGSAKTCKNLLYTMRLRGKHIEVAEKVCGAGRPFFFPACLGLHEI